jgi:hypothetical protein
MNWQSISQPSANETSEHPLSRGGRADSVQNRLASDDALPLSIITEMRVLRAPSVRNTPIRAWSLSFRCTAGGNLFTYRVQWEDRCRGRLDMRYPSGFDAMDYKVRSFLAVIVFVTAASLAADTGVSLAQSDSQPQGEAAQTEAVDASPPTSPQPVALPPPVLDPFATENTQADADGNREYEPLLRGPVHEAFAAPSDVDSAADGRVVPKAPPPAVDEQPPEAGDEAEGMNWIPGYWSWSAEENDYVWVSGLWRRVPPGRSWVAGRWSETPAGYRRTQGYWYDENAVADTDAYLPTPPESIDNGPSVPPPGDDYFWVPGHWQYAGSGYRWRGGFWSGQHSNWVWQPGCYVSTPGGCVWVDGYWDYLPTARGYLYAPVRFYDSVYLRPSYVYRPRYPLINTAALLLQLFVRPGYSHYYYGNFYGSSYAGLGFRPWFHGGYGHRYATPWRSYYDWKYHKSGIHFSRSMDRYGQIVRSSPNASSNLLAKGKPRSDTIGPRQAGPLKEKGGKGARTFDSVVRSSPVRVDAAKRFDGPRSKPIGASARFDPPYRSRSARGEIGAATTGGGPVRSKSSAQSGFTVREFQNRDSRSPSFRGANSVGGTSRGPTSVGPSRSAAPVVRSIDRGASRTFSASPPAVGKSAKSATFGGSAPRSAPQSQSIRRQTFQPPSNSFNSRSIRSTGTGGASSGRSRGASIRSGGFSSRGKSGSSGGGSKGRGKGKGKK